MQVLIHTVLLGLLHHTIKRSKTTLIFDTYIALFLLRICYDV